MLTQDEQNEIMKAIGPDVQTYNDKISRVQERWRKQSDSIFKRLMACFLRDIIAPLHISVASDNLDYFKNHYKDFNLDLGKELARASMFGSRQVAEFIMKELNIGYTTAGYEYILAYASASKNEEWIKDIAMAMAKANLAQPKYMHTLADSYKNINIIKEIFEKKLPTNKPN